jgi:hypothetical protein
MTTARQHLHPGLFDPALVQAMALLAGAMCGYRRRLLERKYSPDQPRVPAGVREGGRWTNATSPYGDVAQARGRLPAAPRSGGRRRYGEREVELTPAQATAIRESGLARDHAIGLARIAEPSFRPTITSVFETPEGEVAHNLAVRDQARAFAIERGALPPEPLRPALDYFVRDGRMIGEIVGRAGENVRTVSREELDGLVRTMTLHGAVLPPSRYPGLRFRQSDGSVVGIRDSLDSGRTIDLLEPSLPIFRDKIRVHGR